MLYLHLGEPRDDVIGEFARDNVGLKIVRYLAERFGGDREHGVETWPKRDRAAAVSVVRAKGGRRESDFVRCFDRHRRLRTAVLELAATPPE